MAVDDVRLFYEILIRGGDDGRPQGAHAQFRRRISLDGELLKEELLAPVPLDVEGLPTSDLMSAVTRDALVEVTRLNEDNATISAELQETHDKLRASELLRAEAEQKGLDLTQANAALRDHIAELEMLASQVDSLRGRLAEAQSTIAMMRADALGG